MLSKDDALRAANLGSYSEMQKEFPKATMLMDYIAKHYPDDMHKFQNIKMVAYLFADTEHSNSELEELIDKIAIANGFTKWGPIKL